MEPARTALTAADMPARGQAIPSLDGLRALSILVVMAAHLINGKLFPGGLGVLVFFVISGFLITRLLLAEWKASGHVSFPRFYARRILRLYPALLVFCAVLFITARYFAVPFTMTEFLSVPLYYSNYLFQYDQFDASATQLPIAVFWSLAIEEHFYIVFPLVLMLTNFRAERLAVAMIVVLGVALGLRTALALINPDLLGTDFFFRRTEMRMDSIATGVLMAALCELPAGRRLLLGASRPRVVLGALAAVLLSLLIRDPWFRETLRYTVLNTAVALLIAAVLFSDRYRVVNLCLNLPLAVLIGRLSYSLYIWHLFVASFVVEAEGVRGIALAFAGSFVMAALSYWAIERPFLRLRRYFGAVNRTPRAGFGAADHPRTADP